MVNIIIIVLLAVAFVIGAVTGLVKGYVKTSVWGVTALLALAVERIVGLLTDGKEGLGKTIGILAATLVPLVVFAVLFGLLKKLLTSKMNARRTLSGYENHDKLEENDAYILDAVDRKDKKEYKKRRKERKKIKEKTGAGGVLNRVFGAVSGAANGLLGAFVFVSFVVIFVDISRISALLNVFEGFISSAFWKTISVVALDLLLISTFYFTIRWGYKSGLTSVLSGLIILGLIAAFGYASYSLAASEAMSGMVGAVEKMLPAMVGSFAHTLAVIATAAVFFLLSLVVIILVGIFLPKFLDKFKENGVFNSVDGVLGAIVFTVLVFALLTFFGGVAHTISDMPVMEGLNGYMKDSVFADCFYGGNPVQGLLDKIPLRKLFETKEQ